MELMEIRRRILTENHPILNTSFGFVTRSNSTCEVAETAYSPGVTLHITTKTPNASSTDLLYPNGYFSFYVQDLEWYKWYWFTAHVNVTADPRGTMAIGAAPAGANVNRCDGEIKNGIARIKFYMKPKSESDATDAKKYIEFRTGGKSMEMSDIKIYAI